MNLVTAKDVAELFGTGTNRVYELVSCGQLPSYKVPGVGRRFNRDEVVAWLEQHREPAKSPRDADERGGRRAST